MRLVITADSADYLCRCGNGILDRIVSRYQRSGTLGSCPSTGEVTLEQLCQGFSDLADARQKVSDPIDDKILEHSGKSLECIPHCKDHHPEACKLIPADRYHSSQGCNARDDMSYRVHAHYHVQDLLKDYPSLESYDGRIGCDVICRDGSYNRQKPLAILHKEIEDAFENSEELLKHLTHQLKGRDEIRLYYVVDAKQSGRCLTLELVKSTGHSLRHRINHIVELTARTRSLFECLSNKVCGYRTLAHLVLEGRYRLTCKLRDIEQRVISRVDELEKVLALQLTCRRDLTEHKRKALQLVLVTHGDISEHLEVFRDGFC